VPVRSSALHKKPQQRHFRWAEGSLWGRRRRRVRLVRAVMDYHRTRAHTLADGVSRGLGVPRRVRRTERVHERCVRDYH